MRKASANPYVPNLPVNPRLFAGRRPALEELRRSIQATREGHPTHVFIEGEWGIGKTSLLQRIKPEFQASGPVVKDDVASENQSAEFFVPVFRELLGAADLGPEILGAAQALDRRAVRQSLMTLWRRLSEDKGLQTVVLMLDNLERARPEFLADVRDHFQQLGADGARYMLVFAGKALPVSSRSASDPLRRLFKRLPIGPLQEDESVEAIRKPLEIGYDLSVSEEAARLIHERAGGHPFFLTLICRELFDLAGGRGVIDRNWLTRSWSEVEERLAAAKFTDEFKNLSDGEKDTLLRASLLGDEFEPKELRSVIRTSLDTYLRRLVQDGLLHRGPSHGTYGIYHPLFRAFLRTRARERRMKPSLHLRVSEAHPVRGREEITELIRRIAIKRLDILDQHFRGRAVSYLEDLGPAVRVRILMGHDPAWSKTLRSLGELEMKLRNRIEVRAWPEAQDNPVPWHLRVLLGDREVWEISHSLDGVGKKLTTGTDQTTRREEYQHDFDRWWERSRRVFPSTG